MLKAYRSGTEALKNMHKKEKLTIEEAETTMVALYEVTGVSIGVYSLSSLQCNVNTIYLQAIQLNEEVSDALATGIYMWDSLLLQCPV